MTQLAIICTIFDATIGPKVRWICSDEKNYPPLSEKYHKIFEKLMDISDAGFFIHQEQGNEYFESANLIFDIRNQTARGRVDMLMISIISDQNIDLGDFQPELESCAKKIQQDPEIWRGLYNENAIVDLEAQKKEIKIRELLNDCLERCKGLMGVKKPGRIIFFGMAAVGKTSILNYVMGKKFNPNIKPTLGMAVIKSVINNFSFHIYDMSGQETHRKRWFDQVIHPSAIIYVHDCTAKGSAIQNAKLEFERIISHYFMEKAPENLPKSTPVLILANKCDLDKGYRDKELENLLAPKRFGINYKIGIVSALSGLGIEDAFKWLVSSILQSTS
jgi:GTPase SAR1 family protein